MTSISGSSPCCKSELDLFYSLPTNTSITSSSYTNVESSPLTGTEENFKIDIVGNDDYIDLNDIYLKLEVQLIKVDGTTFMDKDSKIGPINNLAHSLFRKIDLSIGKGLQKTLVEIGSSHYAYKAYLLNLLNYGEDAKESWLQSGLFYKDEAGQFDNCSIAKTKDIELKAESFTTSTTTTTNNLSIPIPFNPGYIDRRQQFVDGKGILKLIIPLHLDLLHSNRFLINHMGIFFEFERNKDTFVLMGDDGFKICIKKASIRVRKCQIHERVKLAHISALQISPLKYPLRQNRVIVSTIDSGSMEYTISHMNGKIPNKILCGLVLDSAYNGALKENPFHFQAFNLSNVTLIVNNDTRVIKIDPKKNDFIEGYHSINESLNLYGQMGNGIRKSEYLKGNCLFCFNLNPDKGCEEQYNILKEGSISIILNFSENVDKKLKLIVLMEHDNQLKINNKQEVIFDYNL